MDRTGQIDTDNLGGEPYSLESLGLVDCEPAIAFDSITRLASRFFDVPVALISMVQEQKDRQYFVSQIGLGVPWCDHRQTPLSHSFCKHVKSTNAPLIVEDARAHALVKDNAAVEDLNVIAYLGVPIHGPDGAPLGAVCVISDEPRSWDDEDVASLCDFARCTSDEILLRAALRSHQARVRRADRYIAMRDSIATAFMLPELPLEQRYTELLKAACQALGYQTATIAKYSFNHVEPIFAHGDDAPSRTWRNLSGRFAAIAIAGQSLVSHADVAKTRYRDLKTVLGHQCGAYLGVPLCLDGRIFGILEFSDRDARARPLSDDELSLVSVVSMFICAHLGLMGEIDTLRRSESALVSYIAEHRARQ